MHSPVTSKSTSPFRWTYTDPERRIQLKGGESSRIVALDRSRSTGTSQRQCGYNYRSGCEPHLPLTNTLEIQAFRIGTRHTPHSRAQSNNKFPRTEWNNQVIVCTRFLVSRLGV